jgi:hypothetical protein
MKTITLPELVNSVTVLLDHAKQVEQENKAAFERNFKNEKAN